MIQLQSVSKAFGEIPVLEQISLRVERGEIVSLVGPSGSGKTTLLNIVAGLIAPSSGTTLIDGRHSDECRRAGQLGYVFQNSVLLPWRSVLENVVLPLELSGTDAMESRASAIKMLDRLGLRDFADHPPSSLSGGMRQRAAIARALIFTPKILVMDEPFGALDELMREAYDIELRDLAKELHQTVLFVTHSLWEAALLSDRVVVFSPRPAKIKEIIEIDLPRPRQDEIGSDRHLALVRRLRSALRETM